MRYYRVPGQKQVSGRNKGRNVGAVPWMTAAERDELRDFLRDRDGDRCGICAYPLAGEASIDHIVEQSQGGSDHVSNLRLTHHSCNNRRGQVPSRRKP